MRVMFTVLKRFFPFQQTLSLQRSIDSSVFHFELSVLFVHPTIRMNLRFGHLLCAHNRTYSEFFARWRNDLSAALPLFHTLYSIDYLPYPLIFAAECLFDLCQIFAVSIGDQASLDAEIGNE